MTKTKQKEREVEDLAVSHLQEQAGRDLCRYVESSYTSISRSVSRVIVAERERKCCN